ncbi:hypothetical protein MLD38_000753 [Melastoma candidum]|uniref:Uncharacterized protein n=1 Tax=Melastoma candidum TaxID=119954 RepID=A0ACB9SCD5_9MYRT|nr:hypothetical protein MLD38_000753 [Melastoma candidum]
MTLQLGLFIYVDMFEVGSPIPFIWGLKPIPGRQPLRIKSVEIILHFTIFIDDSAEEQRNSATELEKRFSKEKRLRTSLSEPYEKPRPLKPLFGLSSTALMHPCCFPTCPYSSASISSWNSIEK